MVELWAKALCPNVGSSAKFHSFWPITWLNINMFPWGLFCLLDRLKIRLLSNFEHNNCSTVNNRLEKLPKIDKIANFSVCDFSKVGFARIAFSPTFFDTFGWNFQDTGISAFCTSNEGGFLIWRPNSSKCAHMPKFDRQIFSKASIKICPHCKCKLLFYVCPENLSQEHLKM